MCAAISSTFLAVLVAAEVRRRHRIRIALAASPPEKAAQIIEGEQVGFRLKVAQGFNCLLGFACQTLVVYASQALSCVQSDSSLVLAQDTQTVRTRPARHVCCHRFRRAVLQ